mgnify:CR=1 FL=1
MGCKPLDAFQGIGTVLWFGGRARFIVPLHAIILGRFYRHLPPGLSPCLIVQLNQNAPTHPNYFVR